MAKEHSFYIGKTFKKQSRILRTHKPNTQIYLDCSSYLFAATYCLNMIIEDLPTTSISQKQYTSSLFFQKCTMSCIDIKDLEVVTLFKYDNIFTFFESYKKRMKNLGKKYKVATSNSIFYEVSNNLFTEGDYGVSKLFDKDEQIIEFFRINSMLLDYNTIATDIYVCSEYLFNNLFDENL